MLFETPKRVNNASTNGRFGCAVLVVVHGDDVDEGGDGDDGGDVLVRISTTLQLHFSSCTLAVWQPSRSLDRGPAMDQGWQSWRILH